MQNSLTVLGAALIISLGVYFGLTRSGSDTKLPPVGAGTSTMEKTQIANEIRRQEDDRRRIETAINQIEIYVEDANQVSRSVAEAFTKTAYADISYRAEELEKLAQNIRQATVDLPPDKSRIIRILVSPVQHSAHELQDAANARDHKDAHHAFESLKEQLDTLDEEIQRYGRASG